MLFNLRQFSAIAATKLISLPYRVKQLLVLLTDVGVCTVATLLAFYVRLDEQFTLGVPLVRACAVSILIAIPIFVMSGFYQSLFRYSGSLAIKAIARGLLFYSVPYAFFIVFVRLDGVPRTLGLIQPTLLFFAVIVVRVLAIKFLQSRMGQVRNVPNSSNALIYGAGYAGRDLSRAIANNPAIRVVGFVDDDHSLHGRTLNGIRIFDPKQLDYLVKHDGVTKVFLAIPSLSRLRRREILSVLAELGVAVRALPPISEIVAGTASIRDLQDLNLDDLLQRDRVDPVPELL